jgi:hypothetical protein
MVSVIEDMKEPTTQWGISFTSNTPEAEDYFEMVDKETAFRLVEYLNSRVK